jgi:hypothetical protein
VKQTVFSFTHESKSRLDKLRQHDEGNLRAARIILGERQRYEKECRFLVDWARVVIGRLGSAEEREPAA